MGCSSFAAVTAACARPGSTGRPRGVMVGHGNLVSNERVIQERTGHCPDRTVFAGWLPLLAYLIACLMAVKAIAGFCSLR